MSTAFHDFLQLPQIVPLNVSSEVREQQITFPQFLALDLFLDRAINDA